MYCNCHYILFLQLNRPQTTLAERDASQDSLDRRLGGRRTSFMPGRSIASVTRIINQHLFGLQSSPKGEAIFLIGLLKEPYQVLFYWLLNFHSHYKIDIKNSIY